ncbi:hypothetical protein Tco_0405589 [Tanacetum coccineum]
MSSASSAVTYTSVYTDSEPGRVFWGADEEISDGGVPRVIVYGYDGLPMQPVDPPSPDYVPGPEHPPSPIEIPYVPEPEYPEYLVPSEDEAPMEDQPLPADASPVALSPGYVADSDPEEDSEEDHADYPADGGDDDGEPSDDDNDDDGHKPMGVHGADYGFSDIVDARLEDREPSGGRLWLLWDVWIDPTEEAEGSRHRRPSRGAGRLRYIQRVDILAKDKQFHYESARLTQYPDADYHIASQESLMTTLIAQVSSLQGQLSAALGPIQALQARDQTLADDHEGADSSA